MHELGLVLEVLDLAARESGGAPVRRIVLEVGRLTAVLPDALRFAFEVARESTVAEHAELVILSTPGRGRCAKCQVEVEVDHPYGLCPCGSADLSWVSGDELRIRELEVA